MACYLANAQQVNYRITSDDPKNVKAFSLSLEPFYCDLSGVDIHIGYSLRADLLILKRMEVRGDFRRAYVDINGGETKTQYFYPKNETKMASYFEAGASLFLSDRTQKVNTKLVLSSRTSGNYTYTKYIMIPATKRKMFGLRGGLYNNRVAFEVDGNGQYFELKDGNGDTLAGGAPDNAVSMYNTTSLYAGLHWKSIIDVVAQTDYGRKKVGGVSDFYIDVLLGSIVQFSDLMSTGGTIYSMNPDNDKVKRIGWRAGWIYRHPNKVGLTFKFEFGARPGFKSVDKISMDSERIFMMFTTGLNIPAGKKKESNN
ncbi:MAG: hypothetical protein LPK45_11580 [Bacteroidota bacterium]|nr:hypothetical protein [Bacteroidota bacterium]MDX5470462.1 hypothetical protein [Bacteroidota bacterium]